jgi:hypothetical protein
MCLRDRPTSKLSARIPVAGTLQPYLIVMMVAKAAHLLRGEIVTRSSKCAQTRSERLEMVGRRRHEHVNLLNAAVLFGCFCQPCCRTLQHS